MATNYAKITKAEQHNTGGGYKNVVMFAQLATFLTLAAPVDPPVNIGDSKLISADHTFDVSDGFISWLCKKNSVTTTSETQGEDGANYLVHKAKFVLLGDGASTLEQVENLLNDENIFLMRDQECKSSEYVQFGDDCVTPSAQVTFDGKTTADGLKEYTVELTVKQKKYFYTGAVTEKPVA